MSDIVTTRIFTDGEKGITAGKLNDIIGGASIQTDFVATKPVASTVDPADNLLVLKSSGQYAKAPFQTIIDSVNAQLPSNDSEIWSVRLRSYNAIGNPSFEVDQRNVHGLFTPGSGTFYICDRWAIQKSAGSTYAITSLSSPQAVGAPILVPGTNFAITNSVLRVTLTTAQASLAVGDYLNILQQAEGPQWRELSMDAHSVSLLVRSSVAGLSFGVAIRDPATTSKTLTKLCTISVANTWTLIQLPNLPVFPAGTFVNVPGSVGYLFSICLAAGANQTSSANNTWQSGNFLGATGQSNFAASPANSTFDVAFVQHEPGAVCSTLIDKPFSQNLDECLRYYTKSYPQGTLPGAISGNGAIIGTAAASSHCYISAVFKKIMAKVPTVTGYSTSSGTINTVRDVAGSDRAISATNGAADSGFAGFTISTQNASVTPYQYQYVADTGW